MIGIVELMVILAGVAVLILTPIEVNKIRTGWVRKGFKGTHTEFVAAYRKQLYVMIWFGAALGLAYVGLGLIEERAGENYVKFLIAVLWIAIGVLSYFMREKLTNVTPPPAANA